ncbi:hypothetical protein OPV22_007652 [Ensete ventricosum]|uniref:Uncharacterized protein n=1 Tax=Ensete ventricosum TaxID=4639 RepID=A0AAV8RNB0_ENSVE|nr:hypothetical protein OPV22_007652 [Ensete ventricosum]
MADSSSLLSSSSHGFRLVAIQIIQFFSRLWLHNAVKNRSSIQMTSPTRAHRSRAGERKRWANSARIPKGSRRIPCEDSIKIEDLWLYIIVFSLEFRVIYAFLLGNRDTNLVGIGGNQYMGNGLACMPKKDLRGGIGSRSRRGSNSRSQRKMAATEEELLHHQALAMAIHQHQLSQCFDGSMSHRIGSTSSRRREGTFLILSQMESWMLLITTGLQALYDPS